MRFIPTAVHGVLDYTMGILLIVAPWVLGFAEIPAAMTIPVALGIAAILYSLFTNYELGLMRMIPMSGHLWLDFLSGAFLATSPWLFGFSEVVYLPHLILGVFEMAAALTTRTHPGSMPAQHHRHAHSH